ncbi:CpaE family protein [Nocardioides sp. MH1]|uniref:AAA family ATPase n=1 Tax=Nocardioides sp. MH1 TaxID=3242490 RepID=UPI0035223663
MIVTLLVSTGAEWEAAALGALSAHPGIVVLKRCVDVDDLLAAASAGQAQVAVLGAELAGLDAPVVDQLRTYGVRVVAVTADADVAPAHAHRIGIDGVVAADRVDELPDAVLTEPRPALLAEPTGPPPPPSPGGGAGCGRVIAVWGPGGAPGRTTLASALAAELARRHLATVLVDADPYGGAVAQQLGVLDEVSGLLAAARLVTAGTLPERIATVQRRLSADLTVITGLPRPDRWPEVRPGALTAVVERARDGAQVVIDTGFSLERDPTADLAARPERNGLTVEALEAADDVLLVGAADPVGLARLARGMTELREVLPALVPRVVVNRMRPSLGWREADVTAMLAGFGATAGVHFLPDDQPAVDRALVAGRTLVESGESPLTRAVGALLDAMAGSPVRR